MMKLVSPMARTPGSSSLYLRCSSRRGASSRDTVDHNALVSAVLANLARLVTYKRLFCPRFNLGSNALPRRTLTHLSLICMVMEILDRNLRKKSCQNEPPCSYSWPSAPLPWLNQLLWLVERPTESYLIVYSSPAGNRSWSPVCIRGERNVFATSLVMVVFIHGSRRE